MLPRIGVLELVIVVVILLLIFGVGRLGQLGRDLGEGIREFRRGLTGEKDEEDKGKEGTEAEET